MGPSLGWQEQGGQRREQARWAEVPCQGFRLSYAVDAERDSGMRLLRFGTSPLTCVDGTGESESYYLCRPPEQMPWGRGIHRPQDPFVLYQQTFSLGPDVFCGNSIPR